MYLVAVASSASCAETQAPANLIAHSNTMGTSSTLIEIYMHSSSAKTPQSVPAGAPLQKWARGSVPSAARGRAAAAAAAHSALPEVRDAIQDVFFAVVVRHRGGRRSEPRGARGRAAGCAPGEEATCLILDNMTTSTGQQEPGASATRCE